MPTARDNALNRIAREVLSLETLESRKMDSLDFHEHAVWSIKDALERAYEAGREAAERNARSTQADDALAEVASKVAARQAGRAIRRNVK
jgi:hypothetical protein